MQQEIEDRLSEEILHGRLNAGDHVKVDFTPGTGAEDGGGEFTFETARQPGREELDEKVAAITD